MARPANTARKSAPAPARKAVANTKAKRTVSGSSEASSSTSVEGGTFTRTTSTKASKTTASSKKREREEVQDAAPATKRTKTAAAAPAKRKAAKAEAKPKAIKKPKIVKAPAPKKVINTAPTVTRHTFVMGEGSAGELGLGATKGACNVKKPKRNPILEEKGIVDLAVGGMHCIALTKDNQILTWGVNDNKALGRILPNWSAREVDEDDSDAEDDEGLELNPNEATPTAIPADLFPEGTVFTQVAAGDSATFVVTDEGLVYGWGTFRNNEGIWGFAEDDQGKIVKEQKTPLLIKGLKNIKSVTCGDNHALAIDNKGVVYAWGSGQQDQLGRRIVARHAQKNLHPAPVPLPKGGKIDSVIAGPNHSFAIGKDGSVWSWGLNNFAQTGIPYGADKDNDIITAPAKVKSLSAHTIKAMGVGANHSIALTTSGDLLTFGRVENWALGIKFDTLLNDEELIRKNEAGKPKILLRPTKVEIPAKVAHISCGPDHNIAVTEEGKAWAWGFNANLQCGVGRDDDEIRLPEEIGSKHTAGVNITWAGCGGQFSMIGGVDA